MDRWAFVLHVAAAALWLGHMFFWSVFGGPAVKRIEPTETASDIREASMRMGGIGWPALVVLVATGAYMLSVRGVSFSELTSASFRASAYGRALLVKLTLVGAMIVYQSVFGHRPAPRAIWLNMLAALVILGASVMLRWG